MATKPWRMMPKYGGKPLPWPPIVTPCLMTPSMMRQVAADYAKVLAKELASGEDGTPLKWSGQQKAQIKKKRNAWLARAHGEDPHYAVHGTHQRPMQSAPPGPSDAQVLRLRQAAKERGDYVSNAEHQRTHNVPLSRRVREDIVKRWARQAKAAGPVPGKVKKKSGHYDEDKGGD